MKYVRKLNFIALVSSDTFYDRAMKEWGEKIFPSVTFQARQQSAKQTKAGKLFSFLLFSHLFDVQLFTRFLSFIRCCFSYLFIATYLIPVGVMCCCRASVYEMRRDWQVEAWMTLHLLPMFNAKWHLFAQRWKSFHTQTLSLSYVYIAERQNNMKLNLCSLLISCSLVYPLLSFLFQLPPTMLLCVLPMLTFFQHHIIVVIIIVVHSSKALSNVKTRVEWKSSIFEMSMIARAIHIHTPGRGAARTRDGKYIANKQLSKFVKSELLAEFATQLNLQQANRETFFRSIFHPLVDIFSRVMCVF